MHDTTNTDNEMIFCSKGLKEEEGLCSSSYRKV